MPFEWIDYDRQRTSLEVVGTNTNNILFLKQTFEERLSTYDQAIENITNQINEAVEEINDLGDRVYVLENKPENIPLQILTFEEDFSVGEYYRDYSLPPTNNYVIRVIAKTDTDIGLTSFDGSAIWGPMSPPEVQVELGTNEHPLGITLINMGQGNFRVLFPEAIYTVLADPLPQMGG